MGRPSMSAETVTAHKISIIRAAMDMIRESGISSISARPLGARVGMNSALIYRYFKDIDEVILFACVHVLQEYSEDMIRYNRKIQAESEADSVDDKLIYITSWELFCKHAFGNPNEYNTLFFSRHSSDLGHIIKEYYALFPPHRGDDDDIILEAMFRTSDLSARNLMLLIPVLEGKRPQKEIILINDLTVSYFFTLLRQTISNVNGITPERQTEHMLEACKYLADL